MLHGQLYKSVNISQSVDIHNTCVSVSNDGDDGKLVFTSLLSQQVSLRSQLVQLMTQLHLSLLNTNTTTTMTHHECTLVVNRYR